MSILDNEGHNPVGLGNVLSHTDANDLRRLRDALVNCDNVLVALMGASASLLNANRPLYDRCHAAIMQNGAALGARR